MNWKPALLFAAALTIATPATAQIAIPVRTSPDAQETVSGRIIIFAQRTDPNRPAPRDIETSPFAPTETVVIGRDIGALAPGAVVTVDAESDAAPKGLSQLPSGRWHLQAVLDRNGDYNYGGRGEGDLVSDVVEATLPGALQPLVLSRQIPARGPDAMIGRVPEDQREAYRAALSRLEPIDFVSPRLSAFWGRPIRMRGWVALPPGYRPQARTTYPTVYWTHGFGGNLLSSRMEAANRIMRMESGELPPMIWVMLDQSSATGTHEFADSVNNGPWGGALTGELIPMLERRYRMDARSSGRFVTGHSSGGWAALWLQVRYPRLFGGAWPSSPDPSDFREFSGIDLYRPNANGYTNAAGQPIPLVRDGDRVVATVRDFALLESAIGPLGGQLSSFEWVFSPRGRDGRPMRFFDRNTGAVDPQVAAYWREHYDIAHIVERDWARLRPDLVGKIHVTVGDVDTFYLDRSARRLEALLARLGGNADFTYVPGGTHFNLYQGGGLTQRIATAMYRVARPNERWEPRPASRP
jgi:S-formylglutathione hydrolase FrmB